MNNNDEKTSSATDLIGLPDELKLQILSYLNSKDLTIASLVSKSFLKLCNDESLWKNLLAKVSNYVSEKNHSKEDYIMIMHHNEKKPCVLFEEFINGNDWYLINLVLKTSLLTKKIKDHIEKFRINPDWSKGQYKLCGKGNSIANDLYSFANRCLEIPSSESLDMINFLIKHYEDNSAITTSTGEKNELFSEINRLIIAINSSPINETLVNSQI